jgi:hypothetical protein
MIKAGVSQDKMKETLHVIWGPDLTVEVIDVPEGVQHVIEMPSELVDSTPPNVCKVYEDKIGPCG